VPDVGVGMAFSAAARAPARMGFLRAWSPVGMDWGMARAETDAWMDFTRSDGASAGTSFRFLPVAPRARWSMEILRPLVPVSMGFRESGRASASAAFDFLSLDDIGTVPFYLLLESGALAQVYGGDITAGAGGECEATVRTDHRYSIGDALSIVAVTGTDGYQWPIATLVVSRIEEDKGTGLYAVTGRDPIGARLGGRVETRDGAPLTVLLDVIASAGASAQMGVVVPPSVGSLTDVDATVPWLEYAAAIEALVGGTLTWTAEGVYSFDSEPRVWPLTDADAFSFSESVDTGSYYNSLALMVDDDWEADATRKVVTLTLSGGRIITDAAGERVFGQQVYEGDILALNTQWAYNARGELANTVAITPGDTVITAYCMTGTDDFRYIYRKIDVSRRLAAAWKDGDPPIREWDTIVSTTWGMQRAAAGYVVTETEERKTWEQVEVEAGTATDDDGQLITQIPDWPDIIGRLNT